MSDHDIDEPVRAEPLPEPRIEPDEILSVRRGPGANCSSIGSALDLLFLSATIAGAVFAGIAAALGDEGSADPQRTGEPAPAGETDESAS
jgi:hypothetical protein